MMRMPDPRRDAEQPPHSGPHPDSLARGEGTECFPPLPAGESRGQGRVPHARSTSVRAWLAPLLFLVLLAPARADDAKATKAPAPAPRPSVGDLVRRGGLIMVPI